MCTYWFGFSVTPPLPLKLVERNTEFWRRYPERYVLPGGQQKFWSQAYTSEMHDKWLSDEYFNFVGGCKRFPVCKNRRGLDPQVKMFYDKENIVFPTEWDLPTPNITAAYKSLAKYAKNYVEMPPERVYQLNKAHHWMSRHFGVYMRDSVIVSLEEAISRLDMSSTCGSPFNEEFKTKRELFEGDPLIKQWLEDDWNRLAWDQMWTCIFSSSLKEELRPVAKIVENSLRTFAAGAVDATVQGTRLFVDQNEKMYASHLQSASVIGMSPLKGNWDLLYKKLDVFKNGYALDESQYDSSLREFMMWGCARFRWECFREDQQTPENLNRLRTYYRNLVHTLILTPEGILLMKKGGNPSGSVNTVTDNTLILYWILAYAWIRLAPPEYCFLEKFEEHTAKALLGDDNTWTVSDVAHMWYNGRTVIEVWKELGITTTTDSLEPRPMSELDFLSARTVFMEGKAVPLYDRNKLMQSLLFAPQEHITPETTLTRVCALLQIGWTDLPFRRYCRALIAFLLERYDRLLMNDQRWIQAKCMIQSDEFHYRLFVGCKLTPQGYQEHEERLNKPDIEANMASVQSVKGKKNPRRSRQRRGAQKGQVTAKKTLKAPGSQRTGGRRRARTARRPGGSQLTGKGNQRNDGNRMMNRRGCTISEDEFVVAIVGSTSFATTAFPINPGQVRLFPWLSQEAKLWERYCFEMLEFYYRRDVSEFATNGTTGKVMFSVDFDAADAPPATKTQVEDTFPHADAMPSENFKLNVPVAGLHPKGEPKFVRPAGLPGATDIRLYDAGNLFVSTQGNQNTSEVGELRVRYKVRFFNPVLENQVGAPANNSVSWFQSTSAQIYASTVEEVSENATATVNGLAIVNTAGSMVPPAGNYLVEFSGNGTNSMAETVTWIMDFKKNAVSLYTATTTRPQDTRVAAASGKTDLQGFMYVSANGTDAFTQVLTGTGATSSLTVSTSVVWTAQ